MGATWEITPRGTRRLTSSRSSGGGGGVSSRGRELFKRTVFFPVEVEVSVKREGTPSGEKNEDSTAALSCRSMTAEVEPLSVNNVLVFLIVRSVGRLM